MHKYIRDNIYNIYEYKRNEDLADYTDDSFIILGMVYSMSIDDSCADCMIQNAKNVSSTFCIEKASRHCEVFYVQSNDAYA